MGAPPSTRHLTESRPVDRKAGPVARSPPSTASTEGRPPTGGATQSLIEYDTTGTVLAGAPLVRDYGDIAFSPDGSKLYGVSFPDAPVLYTIDPATGAETASIAITGPLAELSPPAANGLTARSDGMLITGSFTRIGTVPQTFGAAQSGGSVYAFASDGTIDRLDSIPTAPSTDPLPVTADSSTGSGFYGATAPQDSSSCVAPAYTIAKSAAPAGPVDEGATITYTVTVANTGTVVANADFTDDLAAVLDDATLVPGSVTASTGSASVTGTTLTYTGVVNPSATATVSYQVTVNTPDTGDRALTNGATPTGQGGSCATPGGCTTTVAVNTPTRGVTVVKSATEQVFTAAGQVLHYGYLVTNTGSQPLTGVTVTDQGPGTPTVTCPVTVPAPGASTTCTAHYTTTHADVHAGKVTDHATVTATTPDGTPVTATSNTVTVPTCKPGEHPWTPGHGEDPVSVQPAHWVTGHDGGTPQTAAEGPDHPGALPDTGTDGARRAATGAGALVTLGFAALATRYDRTRGTGRS
ncbi:hypothetical protein OG196_04015 [Kitasatospora purpeofusca]|uniref:DUF7507 domain-containing protein n=1 Tax=Kitasatospora purpeofusca TaxID=67352 RepID=UPI002E1260CB|nr:hypothetical protein OG196_04015 [Kitasatospora purpeofusca]